MPDVTSQGSFELRHSSAQDDGSRYLVAPSALLRRALGRFAALR
jgi:hypothetical protein